MHRPLTIAATFSAFTLAAAVVTPLAANATPRDASITSPRQGRGTHRRGQRDVPQPVLALDGRLRPVREMHAAERAWPREQRPRPEAVVSAYLSAAATDAPNEYFHATLPWLKSSTTYTYRIGDCKDDWSTPYKFTTRDKGAFRASSSRRGSRP
ncbi:MAG TPA: fibronectin type III domain-containing protein [Dermatophilaceae bacterium]